MVADRPFAEGYRTRKRAENNRMQLEAREPHKAMELPSKMNLFPFPVFEKRQLPQLEADKKH